LSSTEFHTTNKQPSRLGYLFITLCVAATVFGVFIQFSGINLNPAARFSDMIYGEATRPFVYRVLMPASIRLIASAIPPQTKAATNSRLQNNHLVQEVLSRFNTQPEYAVESLIALALLYLSLLGFVFALRYLLTGVFQAPTAFTDLVPLLGALGLVLFFTHGYLYDFSTLLLFTLGLGLMVRANWRAYLPVFVLACLNKETAILLTLVFAVHFYRNPRIDRAHFTRILALQIAIYVVIRLLLMWTFRDNPGSLVEFHLHRHWSVYKRYPLLAIASILLCILVAFMMFHKWREKPYFLLHGTLIIIPLFALHMLWGWPYEFRVFYEVYPITVLLCAHTTGSALGVKIPSLET
jgi:hypothetical protein